MSIDMEHQVRAYAEFLDSTLPVLEAEDAIKQRLGYVPVRPPRERTLKPAVPGWAWAVGAAALTIIVGILAVVLLRLADEQADVIQPAPTTTVTPNTVADEAPIESLPGPVSFTARWSASAQALAMTASVAYLGEDTWRWEFTEWVVWADTDEESREMEGVFRVREGDGLFEYHPWNNTFTLYDVSVECTGSESDPENCVSQGMLDDPTANGALVYSPTEYVCDAAGTCVWADSEVVLVGPDVVWEGCEAGVGPVIAGHATTEYRCTRTASLDGETEQIQTLELYIDDDGRTMKFTWIEPSPPGDETPGEANVTEYEVLEIDLAPQFPANTFALECSIEDCQDSSLPLDPFMHRSVGDTAPPIEGELLSNGVLTQNELVGQRIVFTMWAAWCPPCVDELEAVDQVAAERDDLVFIGGAVIDEASRARALLGDLGITFPNLDLTADDRYLTDRWGGTGIPTTVFIDENGVIVAVQSERIGVDGLRQTLDILDW